MHHNRIIVLFVQNPVASTLQTVGGLGVCIVTIQPFLVGHLEFFVRLFDRLVVIFLPPRMLVGAEAPASLARENVQRATLGQVRCGIGAGGTGEFGWRARRSLAIERIQAMNP